MHIKSNITLLLLFFSYSLFSSGIDFNILMENILVDDIKFQKKENRLNLLIASNKIEKSDNWFDINLKYKHHTNEIIRDQRETLETEYSDITEEDSRWSIELNKSFFQKDLDNVHELVKYRLDIIEIQQELILYKIERLGNLIDDHIKLFEAQKQIELLQMEIDILNRENLILEELYSKNVITISDLIKNLESIEKKESSLSNWNEILEKHKLGSKKHLSSFLDSFDGYIQKTPLIVDTIHFEQKNKDIIKSYNKQLKKILSIIKRNSYYFYLPEINASVSYNERTTLQDWKITENSEEEYLRERDFTEKYPEFEVELSLPFNIFGNTIGKYKLLEALECEILLNKYDIEFSFYQAEIKQLNSFKRAANKYQAAKRLSQLYSRKYDIINEKYQSQPSILGATPEITLKKEYITNKKVELKLEISKMELYRDVFLINYFLRN